MEAAHPRSATITSPPPPLTGAEACHCAYQYVVEGWMLWIWTVCKEKKTVLAITKVFQKRLNWTKPLMLICSLHFTFSLAVQFDDLVHSVFHIGLHLEAIPKRVRYVCNSCVLPVYLRINKKLKLHFERDVIPFGSECLIANLTTHFLRNPFHFRCSVFILKSVGNNVYI